MHTVCPAHHTHQTPFYDVKNTMSKEAGYRYETNVDFSLYLRSFAKIDNF
jgi:hypothetical protein